MNDLYGCKERFFSTKVEWDDKGHPWASEVCERVTYHGYGRRRLYKFHPTERCLYTVGYIRIDGELVPIEIYVGQGLTNP